MRHILKTFPAYNAGYKQMDKHEPWEEAILQTHDSGHSENYWDAFLPQQITLPLILQPQPIHHKNVYARLVYDGQELPPKKLYPETNSYISGIDLKFDGCGTYFQGSQLKVFTDYQLEGAELLTKEGIIYRKSFVIQTQNIQQTRQNLGPLLLFNYAGAYSLDYGVEDIQQVFAALFTKGTETLIQIKTAKNWLASGYRAPSTVSTLVQDIVDGKVHFQVRQGGLDITYKSISYQELDRGSHKIIVHFAKDQNNGEN